MVFDNYTGVENKELSQSMLREARSRLVNLCLIALLAVGVLVLPLFIYRIGEIGWTIGSYVHMFILLSGSVFIIFRKRFSLVIRAVGLLGFALVSAFSSLFSYGIVGSGFFGMGMLACIIAAITLGRLFGLIMLFISTGVFVGVMLGYWSGSLKLGVDLVQYVQSKTAWIMSLQAFVIPVLMLVFGIEEMHALLRGFIAGKIKSGAEIEVKNRFLESFFSSTNSLFIVIDPDLRIVNCNNACLVATGYSEEDVEGKVFAELFFEKDAQNAVRDIFKEYGKSNHETEWKTKQNKKIIVNWNNDPVFRKDGELDFWLISGIDVSDRTILQKKINHSEKMKSIGQLAGGIAHDFNNMLMGVMASAELLTMNGLDEESGNLVKNIISASQKAAGLTKKLLSFSRDESGMITVIDLNRVIGDAIKLIDLASVKNITIEHKTTDEPVLVRGDSPEILNAILNLGINARDAMPEGGTITISCKPVEIKDKFVLDSAGAISSGTYAEISIEDTGTGIPAEHLENIFEPFFTTKEEGKGTGLGLASVYSTVIRHKGDIRVYSEQGHGTVFRIYLPCAVEPPTEENLSPRITTTIRPLSILLVDDNGDIREAVGRLLESFGHTVTTAGNGHAAMEIFKGSQEFDLVLLDWIMPVMDGKDTLVEIRKLSADVPVILMSGFAPDLTSLQDDFEAGRTSFLSKPFQKAQILQAIADYS